MTLHPEYIMFPDTEQEQLAIKSEFYKIARFPNVLGCIDCTHIKIQSPGQYKIKEYFLYVGDISSTYFHDR